MCRSLSSMYPTFFLSEQRRGDVSLCIVCHKHVWCSMLSSSFFCFRAGQPPNDGRVLQSSTDLRLHVDGEPWWRWIGVPSLSEPAGATLHTENEHIALRTTNVVQFSDFFFFIIQVFLRMSLGLISILECWVRLVSFLGSPKSAQKCQKMPKIT